MIIKARFCAVGTIYRKREATQMAANTMAEQTMLARRPSYAPWIAAAVAVVLVVAALVVVYTTLSGRIDSQAAKLGKVQGGLRDTQAQLNTAAQPDLAALKARAALDETALTKATARIKAYNECFPELMSYINGQTIQQSATGGYLTNAYLTNGQQISKTCQAVLYGPQGSASGP
jgi:hypothetical protein